MPFQFFPVNLAHYAYSQRFLTNLIATMGGKPTGIHCNIYYLKEKNTQMLMIDTSQSVAYIAPVTPLLTRLINEQSEQAKKLKGAEAAMFRSLVIPDPNEVFDPTPTGRGRIPNLIVPAEQLREWHTQNYHGWRIQTSDYYQDSAVLLRNVKGLFRLYASVEGKPAAYKCNVTSESLRLKIVDGYLNLILRFTW